MNNVITRVASKSLSSFVLHFHALSKLIFEWIKKQMNVMLFIELTSYFVSPDNDKMILLSQKNNIVISW